MAGVNCATGMSMMMRKSVLEEAGGLEAFSHYLAEDFFFAQSFIDRLVANRRHKYCEKTSSL